MKNIEVAKILYEIAEMLEMQNVQFKPRAYQKAARAIETMSEDIEDMWKKGKLTEIEGVGEHIAEKISELLETGKLEYYEKLKKKMSVNVEEMMSVSGLGPKRIMVLYKKLGVRDIKSLKKAASEGEIQKLEGFGEKVEQDILRGIEFVKKGQGRFLLGYVMPQAEEIVNRLRELKSVKKIEIAGSYRRRRESVGDIDILVTSDKPREVMDRFVSMPDVADVLAKGTTKSMIRLKNGLEVDVRVLKESEYGSALQYFTGNKEHNIELRKIALKKGFTLSEYGLFKLKGKKLVAGKTEEEIYKKLGMKYIEPEMRENKGEIQVALSRKLPRLIEEKDVIADLQMHSDWSEGVNSVEEMAEEALRLGRKVIAITDHVGQLAITHALNERRLEQQAKLIDKLNKKYEPRGLRILKGAEVDILKNGRLALSRAAQNKLDIVLGAIHLATKMPAGEMTARIVKAMESDRMHILAHPTGRIIGVREAYGIDLERLFGAAKKNIVFLELNAYPERLDLSGESAKKAKEMGCKFSIGTDAHSKEQLKYLKLGVYQARRGWVEKKDVLNCYSLKEIEKILGKK